MRAPEEMPARECRKATHIRMRVTRGLGLILVIAAAIWLLQNREMVWQWQKQAHPLVFFALMALLPAAGFPSTPFYLLAGATFGAAMGLAGTWSALAANLTLCYWLSHSGLRPVLARWLDRAGKRLPRITAKNELRFVFLVRLVPGIPAVAKNYLLGLAHVSFRTYFLVSLPTVGLYASCFVVLGESFLDWSPWKAGAAIALLVAVGAFMWWWKRQSREKV